MEESMLTNPRPSAGINAVLGNIPASNPPAPGSLASMTPSVSNNVKEPMVNAVASYPVLVQPYRNGMERYLHPGDLIFTYCGKGPANGGNMRRGKPTVVANLPILNYILAGNLKTAQGDHLYADPDHWNFLGVMRNDMQLSGGALGVNHRNRAYRRMINVDVRGATRCFNYWSTAHAGKRVGLVFMQMKVYGRVDRDEESTHDMELCMDHREKQPPAQRDTKVCYQCVPAGLPKGNRLASRNDLMEIDLYNGAKLVSQENARDIDVGFCFEHLGNAQLVNEGSAIIAACNYQEDRFKLPLIPLFLRT